MGSGASGDDVLVIVVNFGLADEIDRLLRDGAFKAWKVLLVDNASEPDLLQAVAGRYGTDLILLDRNYGFAGAVNRALDQAGRPKEILLVNPDIRISAGQLDDLRAARERHAATGVTPLLLNTNGTIQVGTAGGPLTLWAFASYFLFLSHIFRRLRGVFYTRHQLAFGLEPAWVCMACLLVDGEAFDDYGLIPEDEVVYGEDLAWGYRAWRDGARFTVVSDLRVIHDQGGAGALGQSFGALARLARRVNGPVRGPLAVMCIQVGVAVRRLSRKIVPGQRF